MEPPSQYSSILTLAKKIKREIFSSDADPYSFVTPSAYDTAWLAMVPDSSQPNRPMFRNCLDWIQHNQQAEGFWGESVDPALDPFLATLACMVALKKWNVGDDNIQKGLEYIHSYGSKLLKSNYRGQFPRSFNIVFPAMLELAHEFGLKIIFPSNITNVVTDIFRERKEIFEREELLDEFHFPPLLSYLETFPASYNVLPEEILKHLSAGHGSVFQSPSATAYAFMATGNRDCLAYLQSLTQRCTHGVPAMYPMDVELIQLGIVNQLQRLGLDEYFSEDIEAILSQVYRNYAYQPPQASRTNLGLPVQLFKDSLAFRLLRMHGYNVSPRNFCWFLQQEELLCHIEKNYEYFSSILLHVYRATDLMFVEEYELQEARSFSRKLLEKTLTLRRTTDENVCMSERCRTVQVEHELCLPWLARLDRLDSRMWIEETENNALWMGKMSSISFSHLQNDELVELARRNYEYQQSMFTTELKELKRWSKQCGLSEMGFGREKTTYSYFAVAASGRSPYNSDVRIFITKMAILITVADDFYDMKAPLNELIILTNAIQSWNGEGLEGHSKTIFNALDDLVNDMARKYLDQQGSNIRENLRDIWHETFRSWLTEAEWSRNGIKPSMEEYIETGMISIATHTIVLQASCFLKPSLPKAKLRPAQYEAMTKLLMVTARLLNDLQSYQKEEKEGKLNSLLLYMRENPEADMEEAVSRVREILEERKKEFLKHVLTDESNDLPRPSKLLHLSCLKVFQMFFNTTNRYDSNEALLHDIKKAFHIPLEVKTAKPLKPLPFPSRSKEVSPIIPGIARLHGLDKKINFVRRKDGFMKMLGNQPKLFRPCFF